MKTLSLILITLAIVVLGIIGFAALNSGNDYSIPNGNDGINPGDGSGEGNGNGSDDNEDGTNWKTYRSPSASPVAFNLQYPTHANVRQVDPNAYEIKYFGPNSQPDTEITDGYFISLFFANQSDLNAYVENEDPMGNPENTTFKSYPAKRYKTTSVIGNGTVNHLAVNLKGTSPYIVDITNIVSGARSADYEVEVDRIINSLTFSKSKGTNEDDRIEISKPMSGTTVDSPITLEGKAKGPWYFEATAPVVVTDWDGRIIGESFITAEGEWMTEEFVSFTGAVSYKLSPDAPSRRGAVIFQRSNPSGLPENDAAVEIPVTLTPTD